MGVKDNGNIAGVSSDEEIYMIEQAAQMYCQPPQDVKCQVYRVEGKNVLKVDIAEADENIEASAMHVKVLQKRSQDNDVALSFSDNERQLLQYLQDHGGITLNGYMKLTHISHTVAETSVVNMCEMGVIDLTYHDGKCLITLAEE